MIVIVRRLHIRWEEQRLLQQLKRNISEFTWLMTVNLLCKQCTKSAAKAMSSLRVMRRTFEHIDKESFRILFKAYIRPHIEYCVKAWSPYQVNYIKTMRRSKGRRANWPYMVRLKELKLYPFIAIRRLRGDMIEVFKIMNGARLVAMKPVHLFKMSHNAQTSGNRFKFFKKPLKKITTPANLKLNPQ